MNICVSIMYCGNKCFNVYAALRGNICGAIFPIFLTSFEEIKTFFISKKWNIFFILLDRYILVRNFRYYFLLIKGKTIYKHRKLVQASHFRFTWTLKIMKKKKSLFLAFAFGILIFFAIKSYILLLVILFYQYIYKYG